MIDSRTFRLGNLHLDDLSHDRGDLAEREIRGMVAPFVRLSDKLDLVQDVELDVILTDDMGPHVNRIKAGYGNTSSSPYNPVRNTVAARGITLTDPRRPPLRASIVLDQDAWTKDGGYEVVLRAYLFLHECGHVLQQARGTGAADWQHWASPARTHEETVRRAAWIIWDEFDADLTADSMCRSFVLKDHQGNPVGPGEHLADSFARSARDLLKRLCTFVINEVQAYRCHRRSLKGLYENAASMIGELLLVLAHLSALCIGMKKVEELKNELATLRGFCEYIADDFQSFLEALAENSSHAAEPELVRICNAVFDRVGLEIEDQPQGLYIHVFEPVFCYDSDPDDSEDEDFVDDSGTSDHPGPIATSDYLLIEARIT
jgi:hypothetical protein